MGLLDEQNNVMMVRPMEHRVSLAMEVHVIIVMQVV
jgi:hypothetical protein